MKERLWFVPLVRLKLPGLAGSHDTYHTIPCVSTKFRQGLRAVDDKVSAMRRG